MTWSPKFAPKFVPKYVGPTILERLIASICYFTFGMAGLLYLLITGKQNQSFFSQFNFLQSVLLSLLGMVATYAISSLGSILGGTVGLVNGGAGQAVTSPFTLITLVVQGLAIILMFYGAIWAMLGKEAEMPLISKLVRRQMR